MYCYRCHTKTYDGQKYCIKCGAPLNEDSSERYYDQPGIQDSYDSFTFSDTERRSTYGYQGQDTRMVYIGIGVIVLVIIVLIVVGIVILGSNPFPTDQVSTGDARNESAEQMLDLPDNSPSSPKKPQAEIIEEPGNSPIAVAKHAAAQEYYKYLDRMDKASFMKTAISNGIHMDMLNRQPDAYIGKEVYFGGTVIQVAYNESDMSEVQMRIRADGDQSTNDIFYTYYYLQDGEDRILEDDFVHIYGISEGLITYESVFGNSVTIPLIQTVYLSRTESEEQHKAPALQTATRRTAGEFIADNGKAISFPYLKNGQSFILSDATDYGDCIIVYYAPEGNGSENTSLPRYRIATFDDGSIVVFEPQGREFADIYSIDEGTYTLYKPGKAKNQTSNTSSNTASTTPVKKSGSENSTVIYTGYVTYTSGGLNIRNGPGVNYQKVGKLSSGDQVSIFEITQSESGSWGRIQQGWVSMDYISHELPSGTCVMVDIPDNVLSRFEGKWGDKVGQRCFVEVWYGLTAFCIEIRWDSSASDSTEWSFIGEYDGNSDSLKYTNGKCVDRTYHDGGGVTENVRYVNGSGRFYVSNGEMYWEDYAEGAGSGCVFEKLQ